MSKRVRNAKGSGLDSVAQISGEATGPVEINRDIWAADCETDPFKYRRVPKPFVWGAYNVDTGEYVRFDTTAEFMAWATVGKKIIYAHNGGKYDWHFVLDHIPIGSRIKVINGRLVKFVVGDCQFRDSYSILPLPLRDFMKEDIDYRKLERKVRHRFKDEIEFYLRKDCEYLAALLLPFLEIHGTALTIAGASMRWFEKLRGEKADKTDAAFYDKFFPFYAGGRVQCFQTGHINRPFGVYDIRSAYPDAMTHLHPSGSVVTEWDGLPETDEEISRAFIRLSCKSTGAFFYRDDEGKLSFPDDGEMRVFNITGWEYMASRDTGSLEGETIISVFEFAGTIHFRDYVAHWFAEKDSHPKGSAKNTLAKLHLNSLYGKYAANPRRYNEYKICHVDDMWDEFEQGWTLDNIEGMHAFVSQKVPETQHRFYNVATAASITGYVRAKLWKAIKGANDVIYCDTDCIAAGDPGTIDIRAGLGGWDKEASCRGGYVAMPKTYAFELATPIVKDGKTIKWKTASKGVRISPEQIRRVAMGGTVVWENDAPTFRLGKNVVYENENIGYVKRDTAFQRRKVRMARTKKGD